ncbi:hypothetical protein RB653_004615 [Dictyostelium firmibasis]|uniref:Uncharacterized protein n=1 Tax=Dictyostelium firmibasis TaxID=79012 RepID=A0AAN7Z3H0_9MYCE
MIMIVNLKVKTTLQKYLKKCTFHIKIFFLCLYERYHISIHPRGILNSFILYF